MSNAKAAVIAAKGDINAHDFGMRFLTSKCPYF
jgi:hypothetical protein